jgi:hypothetical protein
MLYCMSYTYPLTGGLACYLDQQRFLDKSQNQNERNLYNNWWEEQIAMYGMKVDYQVHGYALSAHDFQYGEHPTAAYAPPQEIVVVVDISNDSMILSKFGIQSNADITIFVHIQAYKRIFGADAEPKSGDLVFLKEYGSDRVGGRSGQVFEITERDDEAINQINQLMGHYIWILKGTRHDYSFEKNAIKEAKNDQVYDNTLSGVLSGSSQPESDPKLYTDNTNEAGKAVFDYAQRNVKTDVYGDY